MENWGEFDCISDYKNWIETAGTAKTYSFRAGAFDKNRMYFDQLGHFFSQFFPDVPETKKDPKKECVLGIVNHRGLNLDPSFLFDGLNNNPRQGDICIHSEDIGFPIVYSKEVKPSHWILVSHSCNIENQTILSICPGFTGSYLNANIEKIGAKKPNPPDLVRQNKIPRFFALPPKDDISDETLVFDLFAICPVQKNVFEKVERLTSLTFPANAYFSNRLAINLIRDVKGWDDNRKVK